MALVMNPSHNEAEIRHIENQQQIQINHFSHRHPLQQSELHETDKAVCSGCEVDIVGPAYICTKPGCAFLLHDLCLDLPRYIRHHSHRTHPLILRPSPPYADCEFTCDACGLSGHGFTYHCGTCKFDLHVECASLPEMENRKDHQHPLVLLSDFPKKLEGQDLLCYVCDDPMVKGCWMYSCLDCKCGAHLECAGNLRT